MNRALIDHRPWLLAGVAMAVAFWLLSHGAPGSPFLVALKGASVAALAGYALAHARDRDGLLLAAVMALGAAGDVGIEVDVRLGGGLFLLSHVAAIALYRRNRRAHPAATQRAAAAALLAGVPLAAWLLTRDPLAAIYAAALGAMAGSAALSRFSRYRVGLGALLFVGSDLLIFARLGEALPESLTQWLIWPLYYAAQLLICTGVIRVLRHGHQA